EGNGAGRDINRDEISGAHEGQRTSDIGFRRHVKDADAVACPGHARIGDADHVAHARLDKLLRYRQHTPFGHSRAAQRTRISEDENVIGRDVEIVPVDPLFERRIVIENTRRPGMLEQVGVARAWLDDAAFGRKIAAQHGKRAFFVDGAVEGADYVSVEDLGTFEALPPTASRGVYLAEIE